MAYVAYIIHALRSDSGIFSTVFSHICLALSRVNLYFSPNSINVLPCRINSTTSIFLLDQLDQLDQVSLLKLVNLVKLVKAFFYYETFRVSTITIVSLQKNTSFISGVWHSPLCYRTHLLVVLRCS